jgi:small subunit ribosomal protein S8
MAVTDPIADMLTRIRNAIMANHDSVLVPSSRAKLSITQILKERGFIDHYEVLKGKPQPMIKIHLKYTDSRPVILGLERVSKPGLRVYVGQREIPRVYGGLGIAILSTSKGIMTGQEAWQRRLGGELLCYVW